MDTATPPAGQPSGHVTFQDVAIDITVYQCSCCRYTSVVKQHVHSHLSICPVRHTERPTLLWKKCTMHTAGASAAAASTVTDNTITGDHNTIMGDHNTINNITPVFLVGSAEEAKKILDILHTDVLHTLDVGKPETWPAAIFRATRGADGPDCLRNTHLQGNNVLERVGEGDGKDATRSTSLVRWAREGQASMFDLLCELRDRLQPEDQDTFQEIERQLLKMCGSQRMCLAEASRIMAGNDPDKTRLCLRELQNIVREAAKRLAAEAKNLKRTKCAA